MKKFAEIHNLSQKTDVIFHIFDQIKVSRIPFNSGIVIFARSMHLKLRLQYLFKYNTQNPHFLNSTQSSQSSCSKLRGLFHTHVDVHIFNKWINTWLSWRCFIKRYIIIIHLNKVGLEGFTVLRIRRTRQILASWIRICKKCEFTDPDPRG